MCYVKHDASYEHKVWYIHYDAGWLLVDTEGGTDSKLIIVYFQLVTWSRHCLAHDASLAVHKNRWRMICIKYFIPHLPGEGC